MQGKAHKARYGIPDEREIKNTSSHNLHDGYFPPCGTYDRILSAHFLVDKSSLIQRGSLNLASFYQRVRNMVCNWC